MFNHLTDTTTAALGLALLLAGLGAFYVVGRMRFMRTNVAGVEEFRGYAAMLLTRFFERVLQLIGLLAIVAGFGLMYTGVHNNMVRQRAAADPARLTSMAKQANNKASVLAPSQQAKQRATVQ